jgi:hypothetical protein
MMLRNARIARAVTMVALASTALVDGASAQTLRRFRDTSSLLATYRVTGDEISDIATRFAYRVGPEGDLAAVVSDAPGVRQAMRSLNRSKGSRNGARAGS